MAVVTRKTFQGAADRIRRGHLPPDVHDAVICILVDIFKDLNPAFNEDKFREACGRPAKVSNA